MTNKLKKVVSDQVYEATHYLLIHKISPGENIYYYMDDIFQQALSNLAKHFLNLGKLRSSEKISLETLQSDFEEKKEFYIIEQNLYHNLNKIKPAWGEFFGTHRGNVYNAFRYLCQWPCFTAAIRNRIQSSHVRTLQSEVFRKTIQLQQASNSLKRNDQITGKTAQRSALQFIKIQQLIMENKNLKKILQEAKPPVQQQVSETAASKIEKPEKTELLIVPY